MPADWLGGARPRVWWNPSCLTWNLFPVLGVRPVHGRGFREEDDRPGAAPVVLVSDALWQERNARDPSVIGQSILVNGRPHAIVGVMPPGFSLAGGQRLWLPIAPRATGAPRDQRAITVFGRLASGVSLGQARAQLITVAAGLLLEWGIDRRRELATRIALGATRGQLLRQQLTENLLIALPGVPLAFLLAAWGADQLLRAIPAQRRIFDLSFQPDGLVLVYAALVAVVTSLAFGLGPSLRACGHAFRDPLGGLREVTSGARPSTRLARALVIGQIAVLITLLAGASLFDPTEQQDLAADEPARLERLATSWTTWADRVGVRR